MTLSSKRFNSIAFYRNPASGKSLSVKAPKIRRTPVTTAQLSPVGHAFDQGAPVIADYITRMREEEIRSADEANVEKMITALTAPRTDYDPNKYGTSPEELLAAAEGYTEDGDDQALWQSPEAQHQFYTEEAAKAKKAYETGEPVGADLVRQQAAAGKYNMPQQSNWLEKLFGAEPTEGRMGDRSREAMRWILLEDKTRKAAIEDFKEKERIKAMYRNVPSGTDRKDTRSAAVKNWERLQEIKKEFPQIRNADGELEDSPEVRIFKSFVRASQIKDLGATYGRFNVGRDELVPVGKKSLPPEKQSVNIAAAKKAEQTAAGIAERMQARVESGAAAARIAPTIRRSLELLETVKTGGFSNFALRAKQLIGVEGADEGELSQNLGKAVLSQLRATFGAAFTAKEGAELKQIEAGFGKSIAANKRMLQNLMKFTERFYQQGIAAATDMDDLSSVKSMRELYNLKLGGDVEPAVTSSTTPPPAPVHTPINISGDISQMNLMQLNEIAKNAGLTPDEKRQIGLRLDVLGY